MKPPLSQFEREALSTLGFWHYTDPDDNGVTALQRFEEMKRDAERYRALRNAPRTRVMGYAGKIRPGDKSVNSDDHIHAGWEFWSYQPYPEDKSDYRELFDQFADRMVSIANEKSV